MSTLRVSSCDGNPPMVRTFEYSVEKESALREAQVVFEELGYEMSSFDPIDSYFITDLRVINRLFRPIYYVAFVTSQDRLTVTIYSEVRTFMRSSRVALAAGTEQVMQDASNNLNDRFQRAIFDPITQSIEEKGFAKWDRVTDSQREDEIIRRAEELRLSTLAEAEAKKKELEREEREVALKIFHELQDERRLRSGREVEDHIEFWGDTRPERSVVALSRTLEEHRGTFENIFRELLRSHRFVSGDGFLLWIIGRDGRIVDLRVLMESSINTPETQLRDRLGSALRSVTFNKGHSFLKMQQSFYFDGDFNNLKVDFGIPMVTGLFYEYPIPGRDVFEDTLFVNQQNNIPPVIFKN